MTKNLLHKTFDYLTVLERNGSQNGHALWLCKCKCGSIRNVTTGDLLQGKTTSCGCKKIDNGKKKVINEIGNKYGELTVIEREGSNEEGKATWKCICSCGNIAIRTGKSLRTTKHPSCSCYQKALISERSLRDLTGMKFGKLTVISRAETKYSKLGNQSTMWNCICECGNEKIVSAGALTTGNHTRSCGCMKISFYEQTILDYLNENNISYCREYSFDDLQNENGNRLRFDFAFFDKYNNLLALLEMQGEQHYIVANNGFGKLQREVTDKLKKDYCKDKNITLYEIRYDEDIINKLTTIINTIYANPVPRLI